MIEQPPPGIPPEPQSPPPVNQAQGCLRVMLWFIPSAFSVVSWGIGHAGFGIFGWVVLNLGFIGAAGWFDTVMSRRIRLLSPERRTGEMARSMVVFFLSQLALIPVILGSALFAFCALSAR